MEQTRYAKSIEKRYSDGAGVKIVNSVPTTILPIDFIPTMEVKKRVNQWMIHERQG
jgi:hypothetical protein